MKYFTVPLVNKRKKGWKTIIFGQSAEQKHYRAQHHSEQKQAEQKTEAKP